MSVRGGGSAALLADIAGILGIPVEAFSQPACLDDVRRARIDLFASLLAADPNFARLAQAFLSLEDPAGRRALADSAVAIATAFTSPDRLVAPRPPQAATASVSP